MSLVLLAQALLIYASKVGRLFLFALDLNLSLHGNLSYLLDLHVYLGSFTFIFFSIYLPSKSNKPSLSFGFVLILIVSCLLSRFRHSRTIF